MVGGIALVMAGVIFFGGKVFQEKTPYVIFFESSVQGLNVGAPVVFRGVQVGQVTRVEALYDPTQATVHVKVLIELVHGIVQVTAEVRQRSPQEAVETLVQQGLRASLQVAEFCDGPVAGQSRLLSRHPHQAARSRPDVSRTANRAQPN